jgi:tight adherence protein B
MTFLIALAVGAFCAGLVAVLIDERPTWWREVALDFEDAEESATAIFDDSHLRANDGRLVLQTAALFFASALAAWPLFGLAALAPAALAASAPRNIRKRQYRQVIRRRLEAWPDAVREIIAALLASRSLHQALLGLTTGGPDKLRPIWRRYAQLSITMDQRSALDAIRQELADPVSDRVLEVLIIATDAGPSVMLDILSDLAESTNDDLQLAQKLETANLEQRLTGKIVMILPFVLLLFMVLGSADFRTFYRSPAGLIVVAIGMGLGLIGMTVINRLARLPQEPRVFTSMARSQEVVA